MKEKLHQPQFHSGNQNRNFLTERKATQLISLISQTAHTCVSWTCERRKLGPGRVFQTKQSIKSKHPVDVCNLQPLAHSLCLVKCQPVVFCHITPHRIAAEQCFSCRFCRQKGFSQTRPSLMSCHDTQSPSYWF